MIIFSLGSNCVDAFQSRPNKILVMNAFPLAEKGLSDYIADYFKTRLADLPQYHLDVVHPVSQLDLWQELHSGHHDMVFWFSHGSFLPPEKGVAEYALIMDSEGNNVVPLFREFRPGLRGLGVLACFSGPSLGKEFFNRLKDSRPETKIVQFDQTVTVDESLFKAVQSIEEIFQTSPDTNLVESKASNKTPSLPPQAQSNKDSELAFPPCETRKCVSLKISRRRPPGGSADLMPSARIEFRGQVLGIFPSIPRGEMIDESQTLPVYLPLTSFLDAGNNFNLQIVAGRHPDESRLLAENPFYFGVFDVSSDAKVISWQLHARRDGTPFGMDKQLFIYNGIARSASDFFSISVDFQPFGCQAAHATTPS